MSSGKPEETATADKQDDPQDVEFDGTSLYRGALVSYVVDDAGNQRTEVALVTDLFDVDDVAHARVAQLTASLAVKVDDLTQITND